MNNDRFAAYRAAIAADDAWSAELRRVFGKDAGNARYDARGKSTPELRRLCDARLAADVARALEEEIRVVLTDHATPLCARRVAEIVTCRTGTRFGGCGPETADVERALRAMADVEVDEDAYTEDDGDAFRRAS